MAKVRKPKGATFLKSGFYMTPFYYAKFRKLSRQAVTKRIQRGQLFSHRMGSHYVIWMGSTFDKKFKDAFQLSASTKY